MKYIAETFGIDIHAAAWDGAAKLPYYLCDRYDFKKVTLEGVSCLFLIPKSEPDTLTAIKKHVAKVREIESLPIVLQLDGIDAWRRKSLVGARIPFVAADTQIYLPFLGVALSQRYTSATTPKETLMPSSQLLLFHFLYQKKPELYTNSMANCLKLSAMQISRAIRQLETLGIVSVRKDGVRIRISAVASCRDMFEMAKPYILNPVRKRIYADSNKIPDGLPYSGFSALSERTMLNPSAVKTYAYFGKINDFAGSDTLIDSDLQAEVEVWRYSPTILSERPDSVDVLSLIASMLSVDDERTEQAINELLSELWR